MTITQVDTSTGVLADVQALAGAGQAHGALVVVDGVCSVAGEELRMADWGVDLAFTASQKAISVPPGLALAVARPAALEAFRARQTPVGSYYADWSNWLPVMEAYEARKPSYFGTPAVNLVWALNVSLGQSSPRAGCPRHPSPQLGRASQAAIAALGLGQVPLAPARSAHHDRAALPRGRGRRRASETDRRGGHPGRRAAPGHPRRVLPHRPMGPMTLNECWPRSARSSTDCELCGYPFTPGAGVAAAAQAYEA